jgi:septal ring factor EnvC (AmiA/AmiB activator)
MGIRLLFDRRIIAVFQILSIAFALYLVIQLLIKVFGGSWSGESPATGLLTTNISLTFTPAIHMTRLGAGNKHLANQFRILANDFKRVAFQFGEHNSEFKLLSAQFGEHKSEFKHLSSQFNEHKSELRQLSAQFGEHESELIQLRAQSNEQTAQIKKLSGHHKEMRCEFDQFAKKAEPALKMHRPSKA